MEERITTFKLSKSLGYYDLYYKYKYREEELTKEEKDKINEKKDKIREELKPFFKQIESNLIKLDSKDFNEKSYKEFYNFGMKLLDYGEYDNAYKIFIKLINDNYYKAIVGMYYLYKNCDEESYFYDKYVSDVKTIEWLTKVWNHNKHKSQKILKEHYGDDIESVMEDITILCDQLGRINYKIQYQKRQIDRLEKENEELKQKIKK